VSLIHSSRSGLLLATAVAGLLTGCQPANEYVEPPPPKVDVAKPIQQDVTAYLETTGTTAPAEIVEIRPRVSGFVQEIHFMPPSDAEQAATPPAPANEAAAGENGGSEPPSADAGNAAGDASQTAERAEQEPRFVADGPGSDVKQGDRLYTIEKDRYVATLNQAKAALEVAKAKAKDAEAKYARAKPLADKGAVSPEELFEKAAQYAVGLATIKAAEADVEQAELDLNYTTIRSPIDGRVGKTLVDRGNLVSETQETPLTTVIRWDEVYANFNISERALLELRAYARRQGSDRETVSVFIGQENEPGYPHAGQLEYADLAVDTSTGTFLLRAIFDNQDKVIIPGAFVRVRIPLGVIPEALFIPETAVGADQRGRYVLTVDDANTVTRQYVELGAKFGELIHVTQGLSGQERVVVQGLQRARPGATVAPQAKSLEVSPELREALPEPSQADDGPASGPAEAQGEPAGQVPDAASPADAESSAS
jgi:RND family efflux transporter MFP subunit